jgi:hypothetical protein
MIVLLLGALSTLLIYIYAGSNPRSLGMWAFSILFGAYVISPYIALTSFNNKIKDSLVKAILCLITSFFIVMFGALIYYYGFFIELDAQSGILFLFVPAFQFVSYPILLSCEKRIDRKEKA